MDFGKFFHNFFGDERIRKHAGVNTTPLTPFVPAPLGVSNTAALKFLGLQWSRLFVVSGPSPDNGVQFDYWAEESTVGKLRDLSNPFGFK